MAATTKRIALLIIVFGLLTGAIVLVIHTLTIPLKRQLAMESNAGILRQLRDCLRQLESETGLLPTNTPGFSSWRVNVERMCAIHSEYNFAEPWDADSNDGKLPRSVQFCGSRPDGTESRVHTFIGPSTAIQAESPVEFIEVVDPWQSTAVAFVGPAITPAAWSCPRDIPLAEVSLWLELVKTRDHDVLLLFLDGGIAHMNKSITPAELESLFTISGNEAVSRDDLIRRGVLTMTGGLYRSQEGPRSD